MCDVRYNVLFMRSKQRNGKKAFCFAPCPPMIYLNNYARTVPTTVSGSQVVAKALARDSRPMQKLSWCTVIATNA